MIKKLSALLFASVILLSFVTVANAQTDTSTESAMQDSKSQRMELRQQIKDTIQSKREELKTAMQAKRDAFKTKLETIKDDAKKALVERIDTRLSEINANHTDKYTEVLGKLQDILDRVSQGVIDTKVLSDIKTAQKAIDTATASVENQAAKTYTIQITSETALRSNVGITVSQLRKDLTTTYNLVVNAKQSVREVAVAKKTMENDKMEMEMKMEHESSNSAGL